MKENINTSENLQAFEFLIKAITQSGLKVGEDIPITPGRIEVEFKVNGVSVPFTKTVECILELMKEDINRRAAEIAYENITFKKLFRDIENVEFVIREKLEKEFGVKLDEE